MVVVATVLQLRPFRVVVYHKPASLNLAQVRIWTKKVVESSRV